MHADHDTMRGFAPFHACDEHGLIDHDRQEGRHGLRIPYDFANFPTVEIMRGALLSREASDAPLIVVML